MLEVTGIMKKIHTTINANHNEEFNKVSQGKPEQIKITVTDMV